ncbi:hypothetical protein EFN48_08735 [Leuconostoc pseudomesenteroides]|nr:hypothetical protein [Leuconostoc pseudomesenteroides]
MRIANFLAVEVSTITLLDMFLQHPIIFNTNITIRLINPSIRHVVLENKSVNIMVKIIIGKWLVFVIIFFFNVSY